MSDESSHTLSDPASNLTDQSLTARTLTIDLPCRQCGYSLRGLPETGSCPECGSPVEDSLRGDLLRFAAPGYVANLARGARMVWWGIAIVLLSLVAAVLLGALASASLSMLLIPAAYLVSLVLSLLGWWLLSTPDPGQSEEDRGRVARRVLRVALIVGISCIAANIALQAASVLLLGAGGALSPRTLVHSLRALAAILAAVAWFVQFFASMSYVRALAQRIPDARLARRARFTGWFGAIIIGAVVLLAIILAVAGASGPSMLPVCIVPLAMLLMLILYVSVIDGLKTGLKRVVAEIGSAT